MLQSKFSNGCSTGYSEQCAIPMAMTAAQSKFSNGCSTGYSEQCAIPIYSEQCAIPMAMTAAQMGRELNDAIIALENITNRIVSDVMVNGLEDNPRVEPGNVLCSILENLNSRVRSVNNKLDRIESILATQLDGVRLE